MCNRSPFNEDLREIAARGYGLSGKLCGSCRDLHALWPYIRLSRMSTGVEGRASALQARIGELVGGGLRDVLVAGAADTGLLALVANAGGPATRNITVLDICGTPLALCRRLADEWSLSIETIETDLLDLDVERGFDLVLVHGTLHFIDADDRPRALARIRRALRPGGKLVLLFNTSRRIAAEDAEQTRVEYADGVLTELERRGVPLPDVRETMRRRLIAHAGRRESREGSFAERGDVERLLAAASFDVEQCTAMDVEIAQSGGRMISAFAKRRFMAVAGVRREPG